MNNVQPPVSQPGPLDHPGARPQQADAVRGRPVGVALIAIMFAFFVIIASSTGWSAFQALNSGRLSAASIAEARLDLILSLLAVPFCVVAAIGVWRQRRWGLYLALVFLVLTILRFVVEAFSFATLGYGLLAALSRSVIPITIMLYLLHPSIRPVFRSGR
jgi:hypothetical protein